MDGARPGAPPSGNPPIDMAARAPQTDRQRTRRPMMKSRVLFLAISLSILAPSTAGADGDPSNTRACRIGEPACVRMVIRDMNRRFRPLARRCDHAAIFALAYLRTTETFRDTLDTIGYADPASVIHEDAGFAELYFGAFDGFFRHGHHRHAAPVPPAWDIAFTAGATRSVTAAGDALLGFNAHIQRDLPFLLYDLDVMGRPISHEDHTLVNDFLAKVDVTAEIVARFDPTFGDNADPAGLFALIVSWRELAFTNYLRLRDAPTPAARAAVAADIEAYAAGVAAGIAATTAYPPGQDSSARDAFCAAQVHDGDDGVNNDDDDDE
jgi:hypothetical protein